MVKDYIKNEEYLQLAKGNASILETHIGKLQEFYLQGRYKEFWQYTKEIVSKFKEVRPLIKEDRESLWNKYDAICKKAISEKQENEKTAKDNALKLEIEVKKLEFDHIMPSEGFLQEKRYYSNDFKEHAQKISEMFKKMNIPRNERESLWEKYQNVWGDFKFYQQKKVEESNNNKAMLEDMISEAWNSAGVACSKNSLHEAMDLQTKCLKLFKEKNLLKKDRDSCWEKWQEANKTIQSKKIELQDEDYTKADCEVDKCSELIDSNPYDAIKQIKELQKSLPEYYLNKDQRNKLYSRLGELWNLASEGIGKIKREKLVKHEAWVQGQKDFIEKLETRKTNAENFISRLEDQIAHCQNLESSARTDDFAETVRGWIREKENKINEVRQQISETEDKIREVSNKLNE